MKAAIYLRVGAFYEKDAVYIGRGGKGKEGSVLHNPNRLKVDTPEERERNLFQFKQYLRAQIRGGNKVIIDELNRLIHIAETEHELLLGCFCKHPGKEEKTCHGDVILLFIKNQLMKKGYTVVIKNS